MANGNFIVQNGLQVGNLIIDASTGDITTSGNVTVMGGGSINVDYIGVSSIAQNDSSITINDTGAGSTIVIALDGATEVTASASGVNLAAGTYKIGGTTVLSPTALGSGVTASSLTSVGTLGSLAVSGTATAGAFSGPLTGPVTGNVTGNLTGNADTATKLSFARSINGVAFDGTSSITVTAAAGTLTGTTLNSTVTASSLTSVGTLGSLGVTGTVTAGGFSGPLSGNVTGNLTGNVTGSVSGSAATVTSAAQTAITSVGTLTGLTVSGTTALANTGLTGQLTMTGNIIPSANVTYSLGSLTNQWRDVYVGPGSLYVNGVEVVHSTDNTMNFSADLNQNIRITTTGTGVLQLGQAGSTVQAAGALQIQAGQAITSSDGNAIQFGNNVAVNGLTSRDANTNLTISANGTGSVAINDDVVVVGNLTVSGTTTNLNVTNLTINDNIIDLAAATTGTPTQNAGIRIVRGDSSATQLRWNESGAKWEFTNDGAAYNPMLIAGSLGASLLPSTTATYDLGSVANKWRSLYAGNVTVGNVVLGTDSLSSVNNAIAITPAGAGSGTVTVNGALTVTGAITGSVTGSITGNAATATKLQTARNINGVAFDGSADVTVTAAAGTLTGTTLASGVTASSLTSVGTLGSLAVTGAITGASFNSITGLSSTAPVVAGTAAVGTGTTAARADHVHPVQTSVSGNAGTATTLQTARNINGVAFNGSADITVTAAAGTLTGTTLNSTVTASSLTSVGTLGSLTVTNGITAKDLVLSGNLDVAGNVNTTNANSLIVSDPMVYLSNGTTGDVVDTGFVASYVSGTEKHAGIVRDATDGVFKFFDSIAAEPTTTVDFTSAVYSPVKMGALTATTGTFSGAISATTFTGAVSGNATTATTLQTARNINGVSFNGSADITVTAAAGTLTGATLASGVTASSLTSVGTITSGTWSGSFGAVSGANLTSITGANVTGTVGAATNATNTAVTDDTTTATAVYPSWVSAATGNNPQKVSSTKLTFVPSTGTLTATTFSGALSGNATTATTLQTARNINGVSFNGSADITVTAAAGTLTGTTLAAGVTASSLTSVGTITAGTWSGSFGAVSGANLTSLTGANVTGTVANATNATNAAVTDDISTAVAVYPTWVTATSGNLPQKLSSTKLTFVPSTGTLTTTTFSGALSGNATTATTLQTARNINGVSFNGSADITVAAAASTLTGTTLAAGVTASSLTAVGTITSGTWSGSFGAVSGANLTNITGANVTGTVASASNATTVGGLAVNTSGRNNVANQVVRTDASGYLQTGYINSSNGDEGNNLNPTRVWGTNGSDSYMRTYLTSALSVGTAVNATNATNVTGTAGTLGYSVASAGVGYNGAGGPQVMGSTTNAAMLSLHRAGAYAVNMGLDTDNVFKIGGWSDGTNAYRFQVNSSGGITATTFSGTSTTAKYADLAENYQADATYAAGTVVMFGGAEEVTIADADTKKVAGVVSTNPAHLMNGGLTGPRVVALALQGRVPCKVVGPVAKGDLMVSAGFGYAKADNNAAPGTIIGKALQAYGAGKGMIEVVVGRV